MIQPNASGRMAFLVLSICAGMLLPSGLGKFQRAGQPSDLMHWARQNECRVRHDERSMVLRRLLLMSLEQKLGQMLMVGFSGTDAEDAIRFVKAYHVGGLVLFRANLQSPEQCRQMIDAAQEYSLKHNGAMMLIATDQEGGRVVTIDKRICPAFPSNQEIAREENALSMVVEQARRTAAVFRDLGLNMNLAPVVDVATVPDNKVIGTRSFGDSPSRVAELAAAYIAELQRSGIIATAKHFPGHGSTATDSHRALPIVSISSEQAWRLHLLPFEKAIAERVAVVMTAHVVYKCFDDRPATLSPVLLQGCLRGQLGFDGVIITDSMGMGAITNHHVFENAVVDSVNAGADIVLIARDDSLKLRAWKSLRAAASTGRLSEKRIDEAVSRILRLKLEYGLLGCD